MIIMLIIMIIMLIIMIIAMIIIMIILQWIIANIYISLYFYGCITCNNLRLLAVKTACVWGPYSLRKHFFLNCLRIAIDENQ